MSKKWLFLWVLVSIFGWKIGYPQNTTLAYIPSKTRIHFATKMLDLGGTTKLAFLALLAERQEMFLEEIA